MSRSFAQVSLFAMTLGLAALGSTLTPATARPSMHAMIHAPQTALDASAHPGSTTIQNLRRPPPPPPPTRPEPCPTNPGKWCH
jgi:hypothetical protein